MTPAAGRSRAARAVAGIGPVGLGSLLLALQRGSLGRLGQVHLGIDSSSSSTTNRQPVVGSSATSRPSPRSRGKNLRTPARSAGTILAREISPVTVPSHSAEIGPGADQAPSRSTSDRPPIANHHVIGHAATGRPQGSPSHTVKHGRYLLFEWPAARLVPARASTYAGRRGGPATFTFESHTPNGTSHLSSRTDRARCFAEAAGHVVDAVLISAQRQDRHDAAPVVQTASTIPAAERPPASWSCPCRG